MPTGGSGASWTDWIGPIVQAGTAIYAGSQQSGAIKDASAASIAEQRRQFDLVRSDTAPQRALGNAAISSLARLYGYGGPSGGVPASVGTPGSSVGSTGIGVNSSGGVNFGVQPVTQGPTSQGVTANTGTPQGFDRPVYDAAGQQIPIPAGFADRLQASAQRFGPQGYMRGMSPEDSKFLQAFYDVYHTQSGVSRLAGAGIGVAGLINPTFGAVTAAVNASNASAPTGFAQGNGSAAGGYTDPGMSMPGTGTGGPDMSAFFESPDYRFNLSEAQRAIDRSAAARGGLLSGGAVREGERYASGLASREYSSFVDRLMQQAGLGSTGIGASAAAGANAANNISATAMNAGNARASIYGNVGANVNNAVQGGMSNYMLRRYLGDVQTGGLS